MNFNLISGLLTFIILINCLQVFTYKKYQCKENYYLFHRWYMDESKVFLIKNDILINLLNQNEQLKEYLSVDVTLDDFRKFCVFYNKNVDKNITYSPCNDYSYDVFTCFRRFILMLNENLNSVIEKFIEYGNSNYVINELNQSLICNHTINNRLFTINNYYEKNCFICLKGLASTDNECSSVHNYTITEKCCLVGKLLKNTSNINKLNNQFNIDNIYNLNKDLLAGKYSNIVKQPPICLGDLSPDNCRCPNGYTKSSKDCIDHDECSTNKSFCKYLDNQLINKYNLSDRNPVESMCINTFGKFICVRIDCPANYNLKNNKCYYDSNLYSQLRFEDKYRVPKIIVFSFVSLPKNVYIPEEHGKLELFRIDTTSDEEYDYKIKKVNSIYRNMNDIQLPYIVTPDLNRDEAELFDYFSLERDKETKQLIVYLKNDIKISVEAQVIVLTSWHSKNDKKKNIFGITNIVLNLYITN